jgi:hypothetical protein
MDFENVLVFLSGVDGCLFAIQRKGALAVADLSVSNPRKSRQIER